MNKQKAVYTYIQFSLKKEGTSWDFPGGPVVKNPPSNAGDMGSIPGQELRSHMLWGN